MVQNSKALASIIRLLSLHADSIVIHALIERALGTKATLHVTQAYISRTNIAAYKTPHDFYGRSLRTEVAFAYQNLTNASTVCVSSMCASQVKEVCTCCKKASTFKAIFS